MDPSVIENLVNAATKAQENAYHVYSKFPVGCALLCEDDTVYTGCNVENASYGATICAERTAFVKAVSDGHRKFKMVVVTTNLELPAYPCGVCRQFMVEFGEDLQVLVCGGPEKKQRHTIRLSELLPHSFGPKDLEKFAKQNK